MTKQKENKSVIKMCKLVFMFAVIIAIEGCSTVPKCSDPASIQLIEDIFYEQFKISEETKSTMRKYLKLNIYAARSTKIDEKISKNSCSANLSLEFNPLLLKSMVDRFVFISNMDKFMGNPHLKPSFEPQDYRADIEYDIQNTEKDGLNGSVGGLDKLVSKVDLLVFDGVFNNSKEMSLKKIERWRDEVFLDTNNIIKNEDYTEMLHMVNWKEYGDEKASQVEVNRFYCKTDGKFKIINRQYYSEHNGKGYLTGGKDDFDDVFYTVIPATQYEDLWENACGKKLSFSKAEIQRTTSDPIEPMPEDVASNMMDYVNKQRALRASQESDAARINAEATAKETGLNGVFEISKLEEKSATFSFNG